MGLPYYKRYPANFLKGVQALTPEERGVYNTVVDLIYDNGGPVADDERAMCAYNNCDVRVWRRLRKRLLDLGKISLTTCGKLANGRATKELTSAELVAEVRRKSGKAGGEATREVWKNSKKNRAKKKQTPEQTPEQTALTRTTPTGELLETPPVGGADATRPPPESGARVSPEERALVKAEMAELVKSLGSRK